MPRKAVPRQQYCRSLPMSLIARLQAVATRSGVSETALTQMAIRHFAAEPTMPNVETPTDKAKPWNRRVPLVDIETMKERAGVWGVSDREALVAVLSAFLTTTPASLS